VIERDLMPVPDALFKAVYGPASRAGVVVICANDDAETCREAGRPELQSLTGLDAFPGVAEPTGRLHDTEIDRAALK